VVLFLQLRVARPADADRLELLLLTETTTIGVRRTDVLRRALPRELRTVDVLGYPIAVKVVQLPGFTGIKDQAWWCGYGPTDKPTLVVCAVIENGGHGGVAAAPAAAEVFASYFHVKIQQTISKHSD